MPTQLSVNVNKIATLRNSRGGNNPDLLEGIRTIIAAGSRGITVHPRADERHITARDVLSVAALLRDEFPEVEYNIEGDTRRDLMDQVCSVEPSQCTLVPVRPGEITSEAGWDPRQANQEVAETVKRLQRHGIRVSLFVDANLEAVEWAARAGTDRIELYTEPFAVACKRGPPQAREAIERFSLAAERAHQLGLGVNAGHDLDLENLPLFREVPHVDEVSIGHAIISSALFFGLDPVVRQYLAAVQT